MDPLDICFVGTYPPTHCGLATFGASLRDAIQPPRSGVIRVLEEPEPPNRPEVTAEWYMGDRLSRNAALAEMREYDIAILQHEYGIYGGDDGEEVVGFVRASPIPVIAVLHTVLSDPSPHQRLVLEELMEAADVLVTMTDAARRRLISVHDVSPDRVIVVAHGAPPNIEGPRIIHRPEPVVLTWGLIGPGKGLEYGVESMRHLADLNPAPVYVIAGQTHPKVRLRQGERYRDALRKQAADEGVSDRVVFEDRYLDTPSLRALIRSADVVLLPYESREQISSGVLVEAISAGKPVVATAFPHAIEQLSSACGIVVPHEDPVSIAKALRRLLTDDALADSMRDQAVLEAKQLAWPEIGREYVRLAQRVLAEREDAA
jgi:glycosyltransferase involved in cell wall biosynthesis